MAARARREETANRAAREFSDFLRGYVAERRKKPGDDLLSLLISAQEDGQKLSEDELVSSAILLLNAGHEATVHQTGNAVRAILAQGGDPAAFLRHAGGDRGDGRGMPALRRAAASCSRATPMRRSRSRPASPSNPASRSACCSAWPTAIRAPSPSPAAFRPDRTDQKNVSFGAGIHFCIGAPLARLELQVALKVLFDRLPRLALAEEPRFRDSWHFHGLERLVVRA